MTEIKHGEKGFKFGIFSHACVFHQRSEEQRNDNYPPTEVFVDQWKSY